MMNLSPTNRLAQLSAFVFALSAVSLAGPVFAQEAVTGRASAPKVVKHGARFMAQVVLNVPSGFHIYNPKFTGVGFPTAVSLETPPSGYKVVSVTAPKGDTLSGTVVMKLSIFVPKSAKGRRTLRVAVRYQQCNERICLPPTTKVFNVTTLVK